MVVLNLLLHVDFQPPPYIENITVSITSTVLTTLNFTWSPVTIETSCPIQYQINATNCGICSSKITNLTITTCELANLIPVGQLCIFVLHTMIGGEDVSETSSSLTVMLKGLW